MQIDRREELKILYLRKVYKSHYIRRKIRHYNQKDHHILLMVNFNEKGDGFVLGQDSNLGSQGLAVSGRYILSHQGSIA